MGVVLGSDLCILHISIAKCGAFFLWGTVMGDGEKNCVLCGQSCIGQPRIKNENGQYAHQACVKAKQEQQAQEPELAAVGEDDLFDDALGGDMDDLFDDYDAGGQAGGRSGEDADFGGAAACPGCGQRMNDGASVCMGCGFNTQSGKMMSTKSKGAGIGAGGALGGVAKVGGMAASPMIPFIGALIGGAIGAAIWAAISYFFNYEIGLIAWGIGAMVGVGATIGPVEGQGGGAVMGAMAAIVAMASVAGGKYAASYFAVQTVYGGFSDSTPMTIDDVNDEWLIYRIAYEHCEELSDNGVLIDWGEPSLYVEAAYWPESYPEDIQDETNQRWNSMSSGEQRTYRKKILNSIDYDHDYILRDIDDEWALATLVDEICTQRIADGVTIEWPDPNLPMDMASWPEDFPEDLQTDIQAKRDAMSEDELYDFKMDIVTRSNEARESMSEMAQQVTKDSFIKSFMHPFDLIFMFLAVITAYGIASNDE